MDSLMVDCFARSVGFGCSVPDYFLITEHGPVGVDVKPYQRLAKPVVVFASTWTRLAVESRGWRYEVWSEPPEAELENIRFLAGFRREWLLAPDLLDELRCADLDGVPLGEAAERLPGRPEPCVRAVIHHLLHFLKWCKTSGIEVSNHLKWIANEFPVTLLKVGVGLAVKGLFSEGEAVGETVLTQTGRRTTHLDMPPFTIDTEQGRAGASCSWRWNSASSWQTSVRMLADELSDCLFARRPGTSAL
ncbi:hypothetical protein [Streptomyces sp. NBC_00576]|uniref:hypothetical protein n=1 Tax=Streptomyces sp. NBC_00576 TaxID=2903665 RepID=UPI002E81DD4E|nr:hypothetical protein [Streptomyces sp. NBC_00576]WUB69140.1 hypothetical protein OG734_03025 [Streptomyces sp. NBC_00576]